MKILVLSLFLLFLSGTYGVSIAKQDNDQPPKPTLRDSVKDVLHQSFVFWAELVSNWESPEAEREAVLCKRVEMIKKSYFNTVFGISEYLVDITNEVSKEINETYPVFSNKVHPLIVSFFVHTLENLRSAAEEVKPYFETFEEHVTTHQNVFWEQVLPIIKIRTKPIITALNAGLKPYIEDVRKEVAAANSKEDNKTPSEQDTANSLLEENIKLAEFLQKISMFDKSVLKKMVSQLEIFNTKNT